MKRWFYIPRNMIFNIYLHEIRHDDDDVALHDHPALNISIVLDVGYSEVTPVRVNSYVAGDIVIRGPRQLHRLVVKRNPDGTVRNALTIWVSGPKYRWVKGQGFMANWWGFACPKGWVHWKKFLQGDYGSRPSDGSHPGRGCGEMA